MAPRAVLLRSTKFLPRDYEYASMKVIVVTVTRFRTTVIVRLWMPRSRQCPSVAQSPGCPSPSQPGVTIIFGRWSSHRDARGSSGRSSNRGQVVLVLGGSWALSSLAFRALPSPVPKPMGTPRFDRSILEKQYVVPPA